MSEIKVEGLKELQAGLRKLDGDMPKALQKISKASADVVAVEARGIAPKRSGRLAAGIKSSGTMKGGFVKSGGLPYHRVIHFGWANHNIKPTPYLYTARDSRYDEVVNKFEREVAALVDKVV